MRNRRVPAHRRRENIEHEKRLISADHIPSRPVLADDEPALSATVLVRRVAGRISAVDSRTADVCGGSPDELGEMASLFSETGWWVVVVLLGFVAPRADGC